MNKRALFFIFLSVLAGLNVASIRKAEDPIRDTQTNPILYKQKMEEEKDGKKGPLLYSVKNNPHDTFFVDLPYETEKEVSAGKAATEETVASEETTGWWEEQPGESSARSFNQTTTEPLPESSAEEKVFQDTEAAGQSAVEATTEEASSAAKGDDYWW